MSADFESIYHRASHFIDFMMEGEKITPDTEKLVRGKAYMIFYFVYTVMNPAFDQFKVLEEAKRIVDRYDKEHPPTFPILT